MNFDYYPCPFCGYKIDIIIPETKEEIPIVTEKICDRCGNVIKLPFIAPFKAKAIKQ
jgi:hypothetical protein